MGTRGPDKHAAAVREDNHIYIAVPNIKLADLIKLGKTHICLNEEDINLMYVKGAVHAIQEKCPHAGGPLHLGEIEDLPGGGLCIKCPWHSWKFNFVTGLCVFPVASQSKKLKVYPVRSHNEDIKIGFDQIAPKTFSTPPDKVS